jgi:serine/threonine protein kinase/Tfp pilus assembly protein PilF
LLHFKYIFCTQILDTLSGLFFLHILQGIPMIGQTIAHYKIIDKLGGGGMGVVYKAEDTKLKRVVSLKVLLEEQQVSDIDKARLMREARAAAGLRHPNICTVYEVGEDKGISYISMGYAPGKSLKEVVENGPLALEQALDIAIQIAQGLQAAHSNDIIHQDIKSANIIVDDDGHVTVLDFGLAVLCCQQEVNEEGGTVAYMSPEQTRGGTVNPRTDIWSMGVCLYEMLTAKMPFEAEYEPSLVYQIVNQNPVPISDLRQDVPASLMEIVSKALEKNPDFRYQTVEELLADLKRVREESAAGTSFKIGSAPSIAVLPFTNMSSDEGQEYFCDGMAEEIINNLAHIEGLRVVARTSSFAFKNPKLDIRKIGQKLDVETVLEGSVRKAGERLRITAQLINVADGYHLWSESYDRDLQDVFAIQDEIGANIVDALKIKLTEKDKRALEKIPTTDVKAYEFYIRGRQYFSELGVKGLEYARNMFTSAIIEDPQYALAYCGLADCYSMIHQYYDSNKTNIENAMTASRKALSLDSELAEAHASHGHAVSLDGRYEEAEEDFKKAIELSPKLFEAYYFYARACRCQGRLKEATELFETASAVRPEDYQAPILAADTYRGLEQPDKVVEGFRRGLEIATKHLEFHPDDARAWYLGAHAHYELDDHDTALEWCDKAMTLAPDDPATLYNAACLFSVMGEYDKCFECLEQAFDNGFANGEWMENDPDLEAIREDPRYKVLIDRL